MVPEDKKLFFEQEGYLVLNSILDEEELPFYTGLYDDFLDGKYDLTNLRSDLSGVNRKSGELITQIMHPSRVYPKLIGKPMHKKGLEVAKQLMGEDMVLDFDMLINKPPKSNKPTPWHQDAAYWIDLPDKRALSIWFALDEATLENGCMWYTPKSHLEPLKKHFQTEGTGALKCEGTEENSVATPLKPGSCVIHQGKTLHYSRGNSTNGHRRAFILNFRPESMVKLEREQGFDHSGKRSVRS